MSNVFSDSDQDESGEDFSPSEDEWTPGKADEEDSDDDDEETFIDVQTEADESSATDKDTKKKSKKEKVSKRKPISTLRSKLYRKYKPPPKTLNSSTSSANKPLPPKIANILSKSRFENTKILPSTSQTAVAATYESESGSSDDDGLVAPDELDFKSIAADAAATATANSSKEIIPTFDCNAGMHLSDSSDNDDASDDDDHKTTSLPADPETTIKKSIIGEINAKSSANVRDFSDFQTFTKNLDEAKAHMKKLEAKQTTSTDETDITKLLSLGEGSSKSSGGNHKTISRKRKKAEHDSDNSDWENVASDHDDGGKKAKQDIQITIGTGLTRGMSREKKKALDVEACLKRRLNRDIKEKQVFLHKCSFLGWMAHGNYVNRIVNNNKLMKMCLKHLPSKNSYPNGDTELKYFVSFTKWFHSFFKLKSKKMYSDFRPLPSKAKSLELQINGKHAICKHDYVLIFATMLRAIGIQCRVVINMPVLPLRPPQSELLVVQSKQKVEEDKMPETEDKPDSRPEQTKAVNDTVLKKSKKAAPKTQASKLKKIVESEKVSASKKTKETPAPTLAKKVKISAARMSDSFIERHTGKAPRNASKPSEILKSEESRKLKQTPKIKSPTTNGTIQSTPPKAVAVRTKSNDPPLFSKQNTNTSGKAAGPPAVTSQTFSPRKTRSRLRGQANTATTSVPVSEEHHSKSDKSRAKSRMCLKVPQMDGASDKLPSKNAVNSKKGKEAAKKPRKKDTDSDSDSDFAPSPPKRAFSKMISPKMGGQTKKPKHKALETVKHIDLRVLSTDEEDDGDGKASKPTKMTILDTWVEVYNEKDKKWIVIDPVKNKVDAVDHIRKFVSKPIVYAFAWNNDSSIRDVTPRYCNNFHTSTRKLRADPLWLEMAVRRYEERKNPRTIIEDVEFSKMQMNTPLPTSISEFKNHPLYALERHLLKFEAIYPPNAMTLGYIRKEPVYARECVHQLHSREIWVKQARTVKVGEKPYKIVKARPKWNRALNEMEEAKPLEIFGFWQTQQYEPPVAENGMVPRNPYGNVELFKPEMLPIGTRHIQLPSLNRTCKKLNIDCAQAVIGFDFHSGSSHPTFDGFVVCEEFADQVVAQWYADQEELEEKEQKKFEARVYGNWKKLIKGLLIRERLKRKYDFGKDKAKG